MAAQQSRNGVGNEDGDHDGDDVADLARHLRDDDMLKRSFGNLRITELPKLICRFAPLSEQRHSCPRQKVTFSTLLFSILFGKKVWFVLGSSIKLLSG